MNRSTSSKSKKKQMYVKTGANSHNKHVITHAGTNL